MECGVLCVIMGGVHLMLEWLAHNLALQDKVYIIYLQL